METIEQILDEDIDLALLKRVPLGFSKANQILPLRLENRELIAAVADEGGLLALRELALSLEATGRALKAPQTVLLAAINRYYGQIGSAAEVMDSIAEEDLSKVAMEFERPRDILDLVEDAPIIRLLNALFQQAVKERASDIHIEPYEKELEIRLRVDGILRKVLSPPKIVQDALINRVKILASLDIGEKRLPQDGRMRLLIGGKDIDIRVSLVPTIYGERIVLRLLDRKGGSLGLNEIGLDREDIRNFHSQLERPNGIVLVTGPTGSGKTTTIYAAFQKIHNESRNILTVEDPVEYQIKGIGQIQINPNIGLTFASGLRSILRQDPDVLMVGEIRDFETAQIAVQASLTGHLVLSTLHTNDAASAITRLLDMGVEPFLVASSLLSILAQRLVRVICDACRRPYSPTDVERAYFRQPAEELFRGIGCERCKGMGYYGRTGIFELLNVNDEVRELIARKVDDKKLKSCSIGQGMRTLREDGLLKAAKGITTLEEVLRVTQSE